MNLVEKLVAIDKREFEKIETEKVASKQLAKLLVENATKEKKGPLSEEEKRAIEEEAKVTVSAIDGDLFASISATGVDKKGNVEVGKSFSTNAKVAAAGIVDPDLKDPTLLKHLGVPTPAEAAKKIFKGEVNKLAMKVMELSGIDTDDEEMDEEEIKN